MTNDVSAADAARSAAPATPDAGTSAAPRGFWRANRVTLVFGVLAVALAAAVYRVLPHGKGLDSLWQLLFSLTPFVAATIAIGHLDHRWAQKLRLHLILPPLCFLVFFCYFVPHTFYFATRSEFGRLYFTQLMLVPFIILVIALCVRLGGGRTSTVVRLATAMIILQLSGIEDLGFVLTVMQREGEAMPEVWEWADHIAVRLGTYPTATQAFIFIAVHVLIAALVLFVPGRWFRRSRSAAAASSPAAIAAPRGPVVEETSGAAAFRSDDAATASGQSTGDAGGGGGGGDAVAG